MHVLIGSSLDELQLAAISLVMNEGSDVAPRGLSTKEVTACALSLSNPRMRCLTLPARQWSMPLALGEFCWHASASDDISFIAWYARRWKSIVSGPRVTGSCYGRRLFRTATGRPTQWQGIAELFRRDPNTRRAILYFHDQPAEDVTLLDADVPCAVSMQFIYRNDKLDALVFMRSNDIILGLPYDIFVFTMLQEMMAIELGIELGTYHHIVGSLHAYAEDEELCRKLTSSPITNPVAMPPMRDIASVQPFLAYEARIRQGAPLPPCVDLDPYWMDLLRVLSWHSEKRRGQAPFSILGAPEAPLYRQMLTTAPTRVMAA